MPSVKNKNVIVRGYPKMNAENSLSLEIPKKRGRPSKNSITEPELIEKSIKKPIEQIIKLINISPMLPQVRKESLDLGKKFGLVKQKPNEISRGGRSMIGELKNNVGGNRIAEDVKSYKNYLEYAGVLFLALLGVQLFTEYSTTREEKEMMAFEQYLDTVYTQKTQLSYKEKNDYLSSIENLSAAQSTKDINPR